MVAEETNSRTSAPDQVIEPLGLAGPACTASMTLEDHTGWGAVNQEHIGVAATDRGIDLIGGLVPLVA